MFRITAKTVPNEVKNILSDNQTVSYLGKYRLTKSADYSRINYNNIYDVYTVYSDTIPVKYIAYRNNDAGFFSSGWFKIMEKVK